MNAGAMQGKVDVLAVLRRVSRHVPNEDFVEFDDALDAVVELIAANKAVAAALSAPGAPTKTERDEMIDCLTTAVSRAGGA